MTTQILVRLIDYFAFAGVIAYLGYGISQTDWSKTWRKKRRERWVSKRSRRNP